MNMKYFMPAPQTLEDLKKTYRDLAFKHHPDRGGETAAMQAVKNEYDELFTKLKDVRRNKDGEIYAAKQSSNETPEHFKNIIEELMRMDDITIEVIGCFIWLTGNTKPNKEKLKELKFLWHSKKVAWYLKPDNYVKRSRKNYDLDEIRDMYGTSGEIKSTGTTKITSA